MKPYSVVITSFDKRFEPFLVPLIKQIKQYRPTLEISVMINGPYKSPFDQRFRSQLLQFLGTMDQCYPTIFPNFQSLAKLWNRGVLHCTNERVLVLNDDVSIEKSFFDALEKQLTELPNTFQINGSFSHFVINRSELIEVGFFDERLLGLGEEDGDFFWRYFQHYGREISSVDIAHIENIHSEIRDEGYTTGIRTASRFNRDFIKQRKYQDVLIGYKGMFDKKVKKLLPDEEQYPYEYFYLKHRDEL